MVPLFAVILNDASCPSSAPPPIRGSAFLFLFPPLLRLTVFAALSFAGFLFLFLPALVGLLAFFAARSVSPTVVSKGLGLLLSFLPAVVVIPTVTPGPMGVGSKSEFSTP